MSEEMLIKYCSPTLAGMKTASLFNCDIKSKDILRDTLRSFNRRFCVKGLRIVPLKIREKSALIYVYRPCRLKKDLSDTLSREMLINNGYICTCPEQCIVHLADRLKNTVDFPHEIGLFLGYPPADVLGFIKYGAQKSKCTGCWKVYSDVQSAEKTFAKFNKCTESYIRCYLSGRSLEKLVVKT